MKFWIFFNFQLCVWAEIMYTCDQAVGFCLDGIFIPPTSICAGEICAGELENAEKICPDHPLFRNNQYTEENCQLGNFNEVKIWYYVVSVFYRTENQMRGWYVGGHLENSRKF